MLTRRASNWLVLRSCTVATALVMAGGMALADKPDWAGPPGGQGKHKNKDDRREDGRGGDSREYHQSGQRGEIRIGAYFGDSQRMEVHDYYRERSRAGHCPPGLAKKNNGCMPPGQARKWAMGRSLPADVVYRPVEPAILVKLGTPPVGHKFVRVASDILLIAVGTGMVIDAIDDLGRR